MFEEEAPCAAKAGSEAGCRQTGDYTRGSEAKGGKDEFMDFMIWVYDNVYQTPSLTGDAQENYGDYDSILPEHLAGPDDPLLTAMPPAEFATDCSFTSLLEDDFPFSPGFEQIGESVPGLSDQLEPLSFPPSLPDSLDILNYAPAGAAPLQPDAAPESLLIERQDSNASSRSVLEASEEPSGKKRKAKPQDKSQQPKRGRGRPKSSPELNLFKSLKKFRAEGGFGAVLQHGTNHADTQPQTEAL